MILNIKFHSQYSPDIPFEWQTRVCALTCVKMTLDYLCRGQASTEREEIRVVDLIKEGQLIDGYTEKYGWDHECLVRLLRNHGVGAYRQEFKSLKTDLTTGQKTTSEFASDLIYFGLKKIVSEIDNGNPVMVSVLKRFNEPNTFHMVLVVGYELSDEGIKGFYCSDPEAKEATSGQNIFIPLNEFKTAWRLLSIFSTNIQNNL